MPLTHPGQAEIHCGVDFITAPDLLESLHTARTAGFDFVSVPLVHPRFSRDLLHGTSQSRFEPFTRSDLLLSSSQWTHYVVGKISTWLDLDSEVYETRKNSELAFKQEIAWATHLALPAVLLPTPSSKTVNYAHSINQTLLGLSHLQMWVRIPLVSASSQQEGADAASKLTKVTLSDQQGAAAEDSDSDSVAPADDPWEWWNTLRTICEHSTLLSVALELTADLPNKEVQTRWLGEPVKALYIPTSIFLTNKKGYPCLSKRHQEFLLRLFKYKIQVVVQGKPHHPEGYNAYLQYLQFLYSRVENMSEQERFEHPYFDYLQAPLQPLMDNLESQTYETFEKDPIKYVQYEKAVEQALLDRHPEGSTAILMVVGAGRGPLVRASLRASQSTRRPLKVYAVEKNPNAVVTLRNIKHTEGWENVEVIAADMRDWTPPELADILVSELLGSWGDNELSPECLDGAQKFLKPDGISIPCQYTSYAAPLSSSKLFNEVKSYNDLAHFETAYVVKVHNAYQLAEALPCFTFEHPNLGPMQPPDNSRYIALSFSAKESAMLHGFVGYFNAQLYKDIYISIEPRTFSTGMFSWFPLFIPLRKPIYVARGSTIVGHFWRHVGKSKVWYEWCVSQPEVSPVHNPNGRSYWIGL